MTTTEKIKALLPFMHETEKSFSDKYMNGLPFADHPDAENSRQMILPHLEQQIINQQEEIRKRKLISAIYNGNAHWQWGEIEY